MITVGDKTWDKLKPEEKIAFCEGLFKEAKDARRLRDLEWYMNYMFLDGNHYATYNKTQNRIQQKPRKKGEVRISINLIRSSIRAIQNYATRFEPKWEVQPGDEDDDTIKNSRKYGKFLDYLYRTLHWEITVESMVDSLLNTSVCFVEVDWDPKAADGKGQVMLFDHDSFDIYVDRSAYIYAGRIVGSFIAKGVKKNISDIQSDSRYDEKARKLVKSDEEMEKLSEFKERYKQKQEGTTKEDKVKKATVKEFFLLDPKKNDKGGRIQRITYAGGQVLRDDPLEDDEFPIFCGQIQQDTKRIYHRTWTADAIPINKAIDRLASQKIMYVNKALTYEIIAEKGHGATPATNEIGNILEVNRNIKWEQRNLIPLPATVDKLSDELLNYHDRILATNDATIGRMPPGSRSGDMLESLQAGDANSLAGVRKAIQTLMSLVGQKALKIASKKYVASRFIEITDDEGQKTGTSFVGAGADDTIKDEEGMTVIKDNNEVIVTIGSWLGHTKEAQRETLERWVELGMLSSADALKYMEFPNADYLSERARSERLEKDQMQLAIAGHAQDQKAQDAQQKNDPMVKLADQEDLQMMHGEAVPPTQNPSQAHTQAHIDFYTSELFQSQATPEAKQNLQAHIQGEGGQIPNTP